MPDIERAPKEDQPNFDQGRRALLRTGVGLAVTALALDAMAMSRPVEAAVRATANFRDRGRLSSADSVAPDTQLTSTNTLETPTPTPSPTPQNTPTPDATVPALQKDLLRQQDENAKHNNEWLWPTNIAPLGALAGAAVTLVGGAFAYVRFRTTQQAERDRQFEAQKTDREKRDEDRFNDIVGRLSSDNIGTRSDAAVLLRTLLDPKYKEYYQRFYKQIFDITVNHLRLRKVDPEKPKPDIFYQGLIDVFVDSAPIVSEILQLEESASDNEPVLVRVKAFNAFIKAFNASEAHLDGADLSVVNLDRANLHGASFTGADLHGVDFGAAILSDADFTDAHFNLVKFFNSNLHGANFHGANLWNADFTDANLSHTNFSHSNLNFNSNVEDADSLEDANMFMAEGLSEEQIFQCEGKRAIFDRPPENKKTEETNNN